MAKTGLYLGDTPIGRIITVPQSEGGTDTSDATATASDILLGKTAYGNGGKITGTIETKTVDDLTVDGPTVTVPAGYYAAEVEMSVPTVTQATPTISVTSSGLINVIASQNAGYVSAGNKTNAKQLLTQGATEYIPSTSDQTISSGIYLTGKQTIKGDSNLVAENIKSGASIFGVMGTYEGNSSGSGVDVSGVTAIASDVLAPKVFVDSTGAEQTGTIITKTADDLTASGATITVPAGYYAVDASKSVATATQATPSISVSSNGLITASATQSAGYVSSGTKSATKQLSTKSATTYTPSTSNQTISSGYYLTGTQTIQGDSNLVASNIKSGVSIFGVSGSYSGSGNAYIGNVVTKKHLGIGDISLNSLTLSMDTTNLLCVFIHFEINNIYLTDLKNSDDVITSMFLDIPSLRGHVTTVYTSGTTSFQVESTNGIEAIGGVNVTVNSSSITITPDAYLEFPADYSVNAMSYIPVYKS